MLTDLRARRFARAEYEELQARTLSDTLAIASGVGVRHRTDGQLLERVGAMYVVRLPREGWRIAVLALHDSASVIPL